MSSGLHYRRSRINKSLHSASMLKTVSKLDTLGSDNMSLVQLFRHLLENASWTVLNVEKAKRDGVLHHIEDCIIRPA